MLKLSIALKFENRDFSGIPRYFRASHTSSGFSKHYRGLLSKNPRFLLRLISVYCILLFCTGLCQYQV